MWMDIFDRAITLPNLHIQSKRKIQIFILDNMESLQHKKNKNIETCWENIKNKYVRCDGVRELLFILRPLNMLNH